MSQSPSGLVELRERRRSSRRRSGWSPRAPRRSKAATSTSSSASAAGCRRRASRRSRRRAFASTLGLTFAPRGNRHRRRRRPRRDRQVPARAGSQALRSRQRAARKNDDADSRNRSTRSSSDCPFGRRTPRRARRAICAKPASRRARCARTASSSTSSSARSRRSRARSAPRAIDPRRRSRAHDRRHDRPQRGHAAGRPSRGPLARDATRASRRSAASSRRRASSRSRSSRTSAQDLALPLVHDGVRRLPMLDGSGVRRPPCSAFPPREESPQPAPTAPSRRLGRRRRDEQRATSAQAARRGKTSRRRPPARPVAVSSNDADQVFPEPGDEVQHFAFGKCEVLRSDGDRLHLKVGKDGRIREIALEMLKVTLLDEDPNVPPAPLQAGSATVVRPSSRDARFFQLREATRRCGVRELHHREADARPSVGDSVALETLPISVPASSVTLAPTSTAPPSSITNGTSLRFTWPRISSMQTTSCPR